MKKLPTLEELEGKYKPEELKELTDEEVLKIFEGVETVWDYEPTEEEKKHLSLLIFQDKAEYFRLNGYRKNKNLTKIAYLFILRKDNDKADAYINQITNESVVIQLLKRQTGHV
jgi:hypothetical protein